MFFFHLILFAVHMYNELIRWMLDDRLFFYQYVLPNSGCTTFSDNQKKKKKLK